MGWLWNSGDPPDGAQSQDRGASSPPVPPPATEVPAQTPQNPNANEQAFADLKGLFAQIDPERTERASAAAKAYVDRKPVDHDPDSLYATEMSCTQCFDLAYYCSSVGGQLNNIYRFGGLRSCTDQWAKWRFCMRTKGMSEDVRKEKIKEWYQMQAAKYRVGRSSEDVWKVRDEPVDRPFAKSVDLYTY